jgi:flagellar basal-body rod protein FlgB
MAPANESGVNALFATVSAYQVALDYHLERHNVLSSNVAHVDTPGYRPVDLAREPAFSEVLQGQLRRTDARHFEGGAAGIATVGRVFEDPAAGAGNDGNYVSLDREAAKIAANQLRYNVITAIAASTLKQMGYAANDGKG